MGVLGEPRERQRGAAAKRRGAKPPGRENQAGDEKVRVQFHLRASTFRRLGVHVALGDRRNDSAVAEDILSAYLVRYGRGRELFAGESEGQGESPAPTVGVSADADAEVNIPA